jgi:enolase-phosphatase E1
VTLDLRERGIRTVLLDIEGTTTPIAFVHDTLFPFARTHVRQFLADRIDSDAVRQAVLQLHSEWTTDAAQGNGPPRWPGDALERDPAPVARYVAWLMDRDRKSPGLKSLQGQIWEGGYRSGALKGQVFGDVPVAFERWRRDGIGVAIYSSGSVLAQRLLFGTTPFGDLTRFIGAFFDTAVGAKISRDSYRAIAEALRQAPERILFVSDVAQELEAARSAGCHAALCIRPGNPAQSVAADAPIVHTFDDIAA